MCWKFIASKMARDLQQPRKCVSKRKRANGGDSVFPDKVTLFTYINNNKEKYEVLCYFLRSKAMEVTLSKDLLYSSGVSISQNHLPYSLKHVY